MPRSRKQKNFREFAKASYTLCNNWRDTILYNGVGAGYGVCLISGFYEVMDVPIFTCNADIMRT
jgi:hypothetical protein